VEPDVIKELIDAAERYYDASADLHRIENRARAIDREGGDLHQIVDAQCLLTSQRGETLRAAGALLHAVEAYRAGGRLASAMHGAEDE